MNIFAEWSFCQIGYSSLLHLQVSWVEFIKSWWSALLLSVSLYFAHLVHLWVLSMYTQVTPFQLVNWSPFVASRLRWKKTKYFDLHPHPAADQKCTETFTKSIFFTSGRALLRGFICCEWVVGMVVNVGIGWSRQKTGGLVWFGCKDQHWKSSHSHDHNPWSNKPHTVPFLCQQSHRILHG